MGSSIMHNKIYKFAIIRLLQKGDHGLTQVFQLNNFPKANN